MDGEAAERKGIVLSANGDRLIVRVERDGEECAGCRACSLSTLCKGRETGHMDLPVVVPGGDARKHAPGDAVTVAYAGANAALAAAVMFVPALAGLALGGWLGSGFGDAALVAGCGLGFAAGVGVSWLTGGRADALRPKAELITKMRGEE